MGVTSVNDVSSSVRL